MLEIQSIQYMQFLYILFLCQNNLKKIKKRSASIQFIQFLSILSIQGIIKWKRKAIAYKISSIDDWSVKLEAMKTAGGSFAEAIRRGEDSIDFPDAFTADTQEIQDEVIYRLRYKGYLQRELKLVERMASVDNIKLPAPYDYETVRGLRNESASKLNAIQPVTLGQAKRISGVNPADISILMVLLEAGKLK